MTADDNVSTDADTEDSLYRRATINHLGADAPIPIEVNVLDGRSAAFRFSWLENGFELQQLPSKVTDWSDIQVIEADHYNEITDWARATTGCDEVLFFPALLRNPAAQQSSPDYAPIQFAHSDYTEGYEAMIKDPSHPYQQVLGPSLQRAGVSAEQLASASRILTLQIWRNTGDALIDYPLSFCDCRTVPREQLMPLRVAQYGGVETQFDAFGLKPPSPNIENRWYTFPAMNKEEVVVFRAFDSERVANKLPFWTPHSAFHDPGNGSSPRHSIEMRAICLFW